MADGDSQHRAEPLTRDAVLVLLRQACVDAGGQSAWAARVGISGAYVCEVLRGRRTLSDRVLRGLGLQKGEPTFVQRSVLP